MSLLLPAAVPNALSALPDAVLLARQDSLVTERRRIDAELATVAAEIARRSQREAGFNGLAQRLGYASAERFVAAATGVPGREAAALVRVGALLAGSADAESVNPGEPPATMGTASAGLARAVGAGEISILAADQELRAAERDGARIADRERELRDRRSLRIFRQEDGMTRLTALLDPESAAIVVGAVDAATAPRRAAAAEPASSVTPGDGRSREQVAIDALIQLLQLGGQVAPTSVLGGRLPAVRLHVTGADLVADADPVTGRSTGGLTGRIEGSPQTVGSAGDGDLAPTVSAGTVYRLICAHGTIPVLFDTDGQVLNLGRTQRLFTAKQRIALAARDGGCRWPGCDRPPSWCEAHHIDEWDAHYGRTDVADGVLLCRFHHLYVHDRGWRIVRDGAEYRARSTEGEVRLRSGAPRIRRP